MGEAVRVAFCDLADRHRERRGALSAATADVIVSGRYILGQAVERFEKEWAAFCGAPHAIGVASGTDAISLALRAEGVLPGDDVLVPAATCAATFNAVSAIHARPVPVDVDDDGLIDIRCAARALTEKTTAIVPVHLYGRAVDLSEIYSLAGNEYLGVVVDAAQGHGLPVVGTTAFSFYPTKNLGAVGDGGMVVTNSERVDSFVRSRRNPGGARGGVSRLDEMQAAILSALLPSLERDNARRAAIAAFYDGALREANVVRPLLRSVFPNVWHQYVIRHHDRNALRAELARRGIETGCHYSEPPHWSYSGELGTFPRAETLFSECISLPIGPEVTDEQAAYVAEQVKACA
jgi:dTDP-3-amino-3,4,6-trideoxy-alpha-D-glucose transaminase